jgi:hypothetical protein
MRRSSLFGLLFVAMFVVGAIGASMSSAAEMKGPEFVQNPGVGHFKAGKGTLFGPENITCETNSGSTGLKSGSTKEGTVTIDFNKCTLLGEECHSLGDKEGLILAGGTFLLVLLDINGKDDLGILILATPVHIECKFLGILVNVTGMVLGLIVRKATKGKEFEILVHAKGAKEQEVKEYLNEKEAAVKEVLSSSVNEGTAEESGEEGGTAVLTTEKESELIN